MSQRRQSVPRERTPSNTPRERSVRIVPARRESFSSAGSQLDTPGRETDYEEEEEVDSARESGRDPIREPRSRTRRSSVSSPSKRGDAKVEHGPLNVKGYMAPITNNRKLFEVPNRPNNIVWVVETKTIEEPFIDQDDEDNYHPRYLTKEEMEYIVDVIPFVPAAIEEAGVIVQQQIKNLLTTQIMREKIIPLGINILRSEIEFHFYKCLVEPGKTLGVTTSESIGQPLTQTTLGSFHYAGQATAGVSDTNSFNEMFNISPERKNEFSIIHFKNKDLSYDEVFEMRRKIIGVSLVELVKKSTIIQVDDKDILTRGWWYGLVEKMRGIPMGDDSPIHNAKVYLRLTFDRQQLYSYDVSTTEIANIIKGKDAIHTCICVPSPTTSAIVDIYPSKDVEAILRTCFGKSGVNAYSYKDLPSAGVEVLFLQRCIVNRMAEIIIKGVPGLKSLTPQPVRIVSHLKHAERVSVSDYKTIEEITTEGEIKEVKKLIVKHGIFELMSDEDRRILEDGYSENGKYKVPDGYENKIWKIWIDDIAIRVSGVPINKIKKFITACGFIVLYAPPDIEEEFYNHETILNPLQSQLRGDGIFVYEPPDMGDYDPLEYIKFRVDKADADMKKVEEARKTDRTYPYVKGTRDIINNSVYVYADALGTNMSALLSNPYVDPSRCRCNNFHYMLQAFGIEVTRNAYIREFYEHIINNGAFLSPRYLILIAEFVTNQGFLIPITSRGVSRQNIGVFAKVSFEHAMATLIEGAAFTREEGVESTSTAIFVGRRAMIGTGLCQPVPDQVMLEENRKIEEKIVEAMEEEKYQNIEDDLQAMHFTRPAELKGIGADNTEAGEDLSFLALLEEPEKISNDPFPVWQKGDVPSITISTIVLPDFMREIYEGTRAVEIVRERNRVVVRRSSSIAR
jgi:hypothetical protein